MKAINKLTTVVLSSLLVVLGFGGCKSAKKAAQIRAEELERQRLLQEQDSLERLRQAQEELDFRKRQEREPMRLLYGPPTMRYVKDLDK